MLHPLKASSRSSHSFATILAPACSSPGTVAMGFVGASLDALHARGIDSHALLVSVGISPSLLDSPTARITVRQFAEWWRQVSLRMDDEFFGQDSRRMKAGSFAMLCHTVLGSTLRQALERTLRFFGLLFDDYRAKLEVHTGEARVVLMTRSAENQVFGQELLIMLVHGVSCWLVGKRIPMVWADFAYPEPAHSAEYLSMFCARLRFASASTVFCFPAEALNLRIVQNQRTVKDFLRKAPEPILVKYQDRNTFAARIRRRLRRGSPGALVTFEAVARELKTTTTNLRRRLHDEGTNYRSIKLEVQRSLAIEYLTHSDRSVQDIGFELGFSERSVFHRAFKTWTGISPCEFRYKLALQSPFFRPSSMITPLDGSRTSYAAILSSLGNPI